MNIKFKSLTAISLFLSALLLFTANTQATTICALDCPTNGGGGTEPESLPSITEFTSPDGSSLTLDINGIIFLDIDLYDNLVGLTIDELTPIYFGLSELSTTIPGTLELFTVEFSGGSLEFSGGTIDYSLLRNFQSSTIMNLATPDGIVVMDTDVLFASVVPVPAAVWLFGSGLIGLVGVARRKAIA